VLVDPIALDNDSEHDKYEYESDQAEEYGGNRRLKRRSDSRGSRNEDDAAARSIEHAVRLHNCLKDGNDLRGVDITYCFGFICYNMDK
jgi:hypothetical protein